MVAGPVYFFLWTLLRPEKMCIRDRVVGALADTIGFSPLFAVLAVFDLLGALVIWTVLQNKPAIEVAQEA